MVVRETKISSRFGLKMLGSLYWGREGNPGGEDGVANVLADGEVADVLALADGVAIGGDLEDFGVDEVSDLDSNFFKLRRESEIDAHSYS